MCVRTRNMIGGLAYEKVTHLCVQYGQRLCGAKVQRRQHDRTAVENEVADNWYERSEFDYLIYNDPLAYADLILKTTPNAGNRMRRRQRFQNSIGTWFSVNGN